MVGCFPGRPGVESFTMLTAALLAATLRLSAWADTQAMATRPRGAPRNQTVCRVLFLEQPLVLGVSVHDPTGKERISVDADWWKTVEFSLTKDGAAFPIPSRSADPREKVMAATSARVRLPTQPLPLGNYTLTARWDGLESEPVCFFVAIGTESDDLRRTYGWWKVNQHGDEATRIYWYEELVRLEPDNPYPSIYLGDHVLETNLRAAARHYYNAWEASARRGDGYQGFTARLLQLVELTSRAAADPDHLRFSIDYGLKGKGKTYVLKARKSCDVVDSLEQSLYP